MKYYLKKIVAFMVIISCVFSIEIYNNKEVKAYESFAITAPLSGGVVGAGHIFIKWNPATKGTGTVYSVLVDDVEIAKTSNTECEYYSTAIANHKVRVIATHSNKSVEKTKAIKFGVTKKGICVSSNMIGKLNPNDLKIGWYYNWGVAGFKSKSFAALDYVPMVWGAGNEASNIQLLEIPDIKSY